MAWVNYLTPEVLFWMALFVALIVPKWATAMRLRKAPKWSVRALVVVKGSAWCLALYWALSFILFEYLAVWASCVFAIGFVLDMSDDEIWAFNVQERRRFPGQDPIDVDRT